MKKARVVGAGENNSEIRGFFRDYLAWAKSRNYSEQTLLHYDYALRTFAEHLAAGSVRRVQNVTRQTMEEYDRRLMDKGLSLGSRDNLMRAVRQFFRWLESRGQMFADPTAEVRMPQRTRGIIVVPTEEEMSRLLEQPDTTRPIGIRDRALMEMAYGCGLRRSELAGLSIHDPNPEQGLLRVRGKGGKERLVPLGKQALHWLNVYLRQARPTLLGSKGESPHIGGQAASGETDRVEDSSGVAKTTEERLWITEKRTPMEGGSIRQQVRYYVERAGIRTPMNLHSLRKACATHMLRNGAHPVQIQMLLGHANLRHLSQYLSVTIRDLKETHHNSNPGR